MDIYRLVHLLLRNYKLLIVIPMVSAIVMFFLTTNPSKEFTTRGSVFTAITSKASLQELDESRVDFFATKTDYTNLLTLISSRDVMEETTLRLLARHLVLEKPVYSEISAEAFDLLQKMISKEVKQLVVKGNIEKTYQNLVQFQKPEKTNFVYYLLNSSHPHYSIKAVSNAKATQISGSDIVEISYQSDDPGIAYQTLNILIEVFINRYQSLKQNQSNLIVEYFEKQLAKAALDLELAEDKLLVFNKANNIINYYEQTKHISSQQEKIEVRRDDILMEFEAADAILQKLEIETKERFNVNLRTKELMTVRKKLIEINQQLAAHAIFAQNISGIDSVYTQLTASKFQYECMMRNKLDSINLYEKNADGIDISNLLDNWLNTVIAYEGSKAKLEAINTKSLEFNSLFGKYAPLGATMTRIEREISVKEKSYLEILHHLGLAKLKQQNQELMGNMKIVDHPVLPIEPKASKRKILIILIGIISLVFTFLGIVVLELLDKTIRRASNFEKLTGIKTAGILVKDVRKQAIDQNLIKREGLKNVIESIIFRHNRTNQSVIVQFFSNQLNEGKSYVMKTISEILEDMGFTTYSLSLEFPSKEMYKKTAYSEVLDNSINADVILVEIPSLATTVYNTTLLNTATLSYFVVDASRVWIASDVVLLRTFKTNYTGFYEGILNKTNPDYMEDFIVEVPKKRSKIRKYIKNNIIKRFV